MNIITAYEVGDNVWLIDNFRRIKQYQIINLSLTIEGREIKTTSPGRKSLDGTGIYKSGELSIRYGFKAINGSEFSREERECHETKEELIASL